MAEHLPTSRARRRELGQHLLADSSAVRRILDAVDVRPGELVVDLGAGDGALTLPLVERGARVVAVEIDPRMLDRLRRRRATLAADAAARLRIVAAPLERVRLPAEPYRVVANPPFHRSTEILRRLLDDPRTGPTRADLVLELAVVCKRAEAPPTNLLSAGWAPWWTFASGPVVGRRSFAPPPAVDAAVLHIVRRSPAILPAFLAPGFAESLRERWHDGTRPRRGPPGGGTVPA